MSYIGICPARVFSVEDPQRPVRPLMSIALPGTMVAQRVGMMRKNRLQFGRGLDNGCPECRALRKMEPPPRRDSVNC